MTKLTKLTKQEAAVLTLEEVFFLFVYRNTFKIYFKCLRLLSKTLDALKILNYYRYQTVDMRSYQAALESLLGRSFFSNSCHTFFTVSSLYDQLSLKISSLTIKLWWVYLSDDLLHLFLILFNTYVID